MDTNILDSEFRGFFYADGCAFLVRYDRKSSYVSKKSGLREKTYKNIRPQLSIIQRADNLKYLEWVKERYGGSIYKRNPTHSNWPNTKPAYQWHCTNIESCKRMTGILIDTDIPYRSWDAMKAVNEYCIWRLSLGRFNKYNPQQYKEKISGWIERVTKAHKYQE
jgi:hypothetical protein